MLSELSIIMPTKNNQHMLKDIIEYHAGTNVSFYILDASEKKYKQFQNLEKYKNIHYLHMPNTDFYERVSAVLPKITTSYVTYRSDRRHLTNNYLQLAVNFLKNNIDYSAMHGVWLEEKNLKPVFISQLLSRCRELDSPIERCRLFPLAYDPSFYSVARVEHMRFAFDTACVVSKNISNIYYQEYLLAFLLSFFGKEKNTTHLQAINQNTSSNSGYINQWYEAKKIFDSKENLKFIHNVIYKNTQKYNLNYDSKLIYDALKEYHKCFSQRFLFNRINIETDSESSIASYGYIEKLYKMINGTATQDVNYMNNSLALLCTQHFQKEIKYLDIKPFFTEKDLEEQENIIELIKKIKMTKWSLIKKIRRKIKLLFKK